MRNDKDWLDYLGGGFNTTTTRCPSCRESVTEFEIRRQAYPTPESSSSFHPCGCYLEGAVFPLTELNQKEL